MDRCSVRMVGKYDILVYLMVTYSLDFLDSQQCVLFPGLIFMHLTAALRFLAVVGLGVCLVGVSVAGSNILFVIFSFVSRGWKT